MSWFDDIGIICCDIKAVAIGDRAGLTKIVIVARPPGVSAEMRLGKLMRGRGILSGNGLESTTDEPVRLYAFRMAAAGGA